MLLLFILASCLNANLATTKLKEDLPLQWEKKIIWLCREMGKVVTFFFFLKVSRKNQPFSNYLQNHWNTCILLLLHILVSCFYASKLKEDLPVWEKIIWLWREMGKVVTRHHSENIVSQVIIVSTILRLHWFPFYYWCMTLVQEFLTKELNCSK